MPELPEVETVRKALELRLKNQTITDLTIIYPRIFEHEEIEQVKKKIIGQVIKEIKRRAKWLLFYLDDYVLLSHLRMEGKYLYRNINEEILKHEHVIFVIDNKFELRYQDTRKFGRMHLFKKEELNSDKSPLKALGLEPWDEALTISYLKEKWKNKTIPIKTALLDQTVIGGIGNIYANEILFLAKINPYKKSKDLKSKELELLIKSTKEVLEEAIKKGGTTIRSYTSEEGITGKFQNELYVHAKENELCPVCKTKIKREKMNGRSSYFCPKCQK